MSSIFRNQVTVERLRELLHYDPDSGEWTWLVSPSQNIPAGSRAGADCDGYRIIRITPSRYKAHRLAWLYMTGQWPVGEVDHRDLDKGNNRWGNLRVATHGQNIANTPLGCRNKSGFKGVSWYKTTNRWVAQITSKNKRTTLGYFRKAEDAHAAYCDAAKRMHGEFARLA